MSKQPNATMSSQSSDPSMNKSQNKLYTSNNTSNYSQDDLRMNHFGKRQRFKRNFGLLSIIGLSSTLTLTWEGSLAELLPTLANGGTSGAFAAVLVVFFGVLAQVLVMSELASMIPLSGGQFHWVAVLAPGRSAKFLSYLTGWSTTLAWQAGYLGTTYGLGVLIQSLAILNYPNYVPQMWHTTLIGFAVNFLSLAVTTLGSRIFPKVEAVFLILHIFAFFGILITLTYLAPQNSPTAVFETFINGGGFTSEGQSWFVGAAQMAFAFASVDAAAHMAEEVEDAVRVIPKAMIASILLNGGMAIGIVTTVLFAMGDPFAIFGAPELFPFPFMQTFASVTGSVSGGSAMTSLVILLGFSSSFAYLTTTSRMLWAFAREDGLPFSKFIKRIEPRSCIPVVAISVTVVINLLLTLISLGSPTAFSAFSSLTVVGFYGSFMIVAAVMLLKRFTTNEENFLWGPFRLGRAGIPITIFALIYSTIFWLFSFWPSELPVSAATWQWSFVVYWATLLLAVGWYFIAGHKFYNGPQLEFEAVIGEKNSKGYGRV